MHVNIICFDVSMCQLCGRPHIFANQDWSRPKAHFISFLEFFASNCSIVMVLTNVTYLDKYHLQNIFLIYKIVPHII